MKIVGLVILRYGKGFDMAEDQEKLQPAEDAELDSYDSLPVDAEEADLQPDYDHEEVDNTESEESEEGEEE